jgi:hypothetical protein
MNPTEVITDNIYTKVYTIQKEIDHYIILHNWCRGALDAVKEYKRFDPSDN